MWAAVLAKWVAPMDAARGAKALVDMLSGLDAYPDAAFTEQSAREIAMTGRIMGDGSHAPLTRVPTFGELELVLARWWFLNRPDKPPPAVEYIPVAYRVDIPKPRDPPTEAEVAYVGDIVHRLKWDLETAAAAREDARPEPAQRRNPAEMSEQQLLETYEKAGPAGAVRARLLRQKLAAAGLVKTFEDQPEIAVYADEEEAIPE